MTFIRSQFNAARAMIPIYIMIFSFLRQRNFGKDKHMKTKFVTDKQNPLKRNRRVIVPDEHRSLCGLRTIEQTQASREQVLIRKKHQKTKGYTVKTQTWLLSFLLKDCKSFKQRYANKVGTYLRRHSLHNIVCSTKKNNSFNPEIHVRVRKLL